MAPSDEVCEPGVGTQTEKSSSLLATSLIFEVVPPGLGLRFQKKNDRFHANDHSERNSYWRTIATQKEGATLCDVEENGDEKVAIDQERCP